MDMLHRRTRTVPGGTAWALSPKDYLFSLIYHVLVHKKRIAPDYLSRICALATSLNYPCLSSRTELMVFLQDKWMTEHNYSFVRPMKKNLLFNVDGIR